MKDIHIKSIPLLILLIQMFLSIMESIIMVKMLSFYSFLRTYIIMKVLSSFYSSIESTELARQIIPHVDVLPIEVVDDNPLVLENDNEFDKLNDKSWSSILVRPGLFNDLNIDLILNDYPHVFHLYIQYSSFQRISSLTISSFPELVLLTCEYESLRNVTKLTLSSIF